MNIDSDTLDMLGWWDYLDDRLARYEFHDVRILIGPSTWLSVSRKDFIWQVLQAIVDETSSSLEP